MYGRHQLRSREPGDSPGHRRGTKGKAMGRHSASYIAAQQAVSSEPAVVGAAKYVGRVGALALAIGVGAAVAGSAALAHADESNNGGTGGGGPAQTSPDPAAAKSAPADPSTDESSGTTTTKPGSFNVSKMLGLGGGAPSGAQQTGESDSDSLTGLISQIPKQVAAIFGGGPIPGANSPTHGEPETADSPPESNRSSRRTDKAQPSAPTTPAPSAPPPMISRPRQVSRPSRSASRRHPRRTPAANSGSSPRRSQLPRQNPRRRSPRLRRLRPQRALPIRSRRWSRAS